MRRASGAPPIAYIHNTVSLKVVASALMPQVRPPFVADLWPNRSIVYIHFVKKPD